MNILIISISTYTLGEKMGWFRRRIPEELYQDQKEEKPPYLSLSDGSVRYRNLEEKRKREIQKGILDYKMERAELEEMEREMYRFISDPSLKDQAEIRSFNSGKNLRNATIMILSSLFFMILMQLVMGMTLIISVVVSTLMACIFVVLYIYLKKHQNKLERTRMEKAIDGIGPPPSNWVVLGNRRMEVCYSSESEIVPIHYLDIASASDHVIDHFEGHKVRQNDKIRLAPDPWKVKGALYPPNTPMDDLIVIGLAKELDLPSFTYTGWGTSSTKVPYMGVRRKTGRIIIAIRSDEKDRFIEKLNSNLKRRQELEKDGYLDEWN